MEYALIFIITFVVRIISVTVGGGAMVLLPMLIFIGLTPAEAVATNRLSSFSINLSIIKFQKHKLIKWRLALYMLIPAIVGAVFGGIVVVHLDQELFKKILGLVILISLPMLFIKKDIGLKEFKITKPKLILGSAAMLIAGFLGGAFASTGIWIGYIFLIFGLTMLQVAGTKKVVGAAIGISSFIVLFFAGLVNWPYAITMMVASGSGAWIGVSLGIKAGDKWIKKLFILIILASAVKLIFF